MRSGLIDLVGYYAGPNLKGAGYLRYAGREGYYWAATAYSTNNAHRLTFTPTGVSPSGSPYRYFGFSLRCLQE